MVRLSFCKKYCDEDEVAYLFCASAQDFSDLSKDQFLEIPPLETSEASEFLDYYNQIISTTREKNVNNEMFQCTPFAHKNTWQSSFYMGLESFSRLKMLIKKQNSVTVVFRDFSWYLMALSYCEKQKNHEFQYNAYEYIFCLFRKWASFVYQINRVFQAFRHMIFLIRPFAAKLRKALNGDYSYIFASVWFPETVKNIAKNKKDPFFGDIPFLMNSRNIKSAIFCHLENFNQQTFDDFSRAHIPDVYTYCDVLNWMDVLKIVLKMAFFRIQLPPPLSEYKEVILEDLKKACSQQVCHVQLIKLAFEKLLIKNSAAHVIYMYEGNCWEMGCAIAAREALPRRAHIGYQHTAFSRAFFKLEKNSFSEPDAILTTGEMSKKILSKHFGHPEEKLFESCSLRLPGVYLQSPKYEFPKKIKTILVLLQGVVHDMSFIKRIVNDVPFKPDIEILFRQHPAQPVQFIADLTARNPLYKKSEIANLYEDILRADLVLYHGTTAAFEAAYLGVPCVFVDIMGPLNADPLFEILNNCMVHRWEVHKDFWELIEDILLEAGRFKADHAFLQDYFSKYFSNPDSFAQERFIETILLFSNTFHT